jgi:hypothetical protein
MPETLKPYTTIIDFVTGKKLPNIGAEENRQAVARFLVEDKGYLKSDIAIDVDIAMTIAGEAYQSQIDLAVSLDQGSVYFMVFKCAAASLGSREREIVAAARLLEPNYQIPYAVVSDGKAAIVLDTVSGKKIGEGMTAIPSKEQALGTFKSIALIPLPEERLDRERLIFRTYDCQTVNVQRNL